MADVVDMELNSYFAWDDVHFESDLDGSVSSIDDKPLEPGRSDVHGGRQISSSLNVAEKLSDRQVLEAMNKLLKVGIFVVFPVIE